MENSVAPIQAAVSAAPTTVAAFAAPVAEPASNQTATVRGTKPYVLTCERNFNQSLRLAAESLGVKTVEVLSRKALLVEADAAALSRIRADRRFSVEREFLPSDKIAPRLAAKIAGGAGDVEVSVVTLSPADHRLVQDRVVARGGEILTGCINEGTTFRARMSASLVSEFASFGDVRWMEAFNRPRPLNNLAVTNVAMNVQEAWNVLGLSGAGQNVSTSDSGIDTGDTETMHADLKDQVAGIKVVEGCLDHDEDGHGTHTAGSIVGTGAMWTNETGIVRGTAYGAQLYAWFCVRADGFLGMPKTMAELFRGNAEGSEWDAYIHSASWGSEGSAGEYDTQCVDVDRYVWEHPEFLPVFAAGNEGDDGARTISSPAAAKNVLAVGATQNLRKDHDGGWGNGDPKVTATFSSRGPCQDGRTKPDIAAPGVGILSTRAFGVDYKIYGIYDDYYAYDSGTSMACPLTAGAVALVREWLMKRTEEFADEDGKRPTAALMKAIVTGGAKDAARPNNNQGWGRVDLMETLAPSNRAVKLIDRIPFAEGEEFTWVVETTNAAPLDVQLAWIDHPGAASGSQAAARIVNDLDLAVCAADSGDTLYGNGGNSADKLNTLESVRISSADPKRYFVTVSCPHIMYDCTKGGAAALYIRGAFDPGTVEPYWTVRIVKSPAVTNTYFRLDEALNAAGNGDVIEILDTVELHRNVTLTNAYALTITATNANPHATPITRRRHADVLVRNGSLFFTNTVFQTETAAPVKVADFGLVKVAGTAVFDDIVSGKPGIEVGSPECFELAGRLENGITIDCTGASVPGSRFGTYRCGDQVAAESAGLLVSSYAQDCAGAAEGSGGSGILKWSNTVPVNPKVAVAYVDGDTQVYYRTLDRLFDDHRSGTNVVVTKSGLRLEKPRTLSGKQSISAENGVGEIVIRPEGTAGFAVGEGCDLTVSGLTFTGYTGNGLFVVNGADAKLSVMDSVFRDFTGTNKWSGAIAVRKGFASVTGSTFENCRAAGKKSYGGGLYLAGSGCTLDLDGGMITGCSATTYGGGVYAGAESVVRVRGALTVRGNKSDSNTGADNIHLANQKASLVLSGGMTGVDSVGVRYFSSGDGFGNGVGNMFAKVADGVDKETAESAATAFFNDTKEEGTKGTVNDDGTRLLWAVRTDADRQVAPDNPDATIRVTKGGDQRYYIEPEYAFAWIDADATAEVLKDAEFGGDLPVTNGVKVTLVSTNATPYTLTRQGEFAIRVLSGASLTVSNVVLDGNAPVGSNGLIKVESAALELQSGAVVRNVIGAADRASGAISVQKSGVFTMRSGAEISNCRNEYVNKGSKSGYGGGLLVEDHSTAKLLGGIIEDCRANRGGGVFIGTESTVDIAGDMKICWNYRNDDDWDPEGDNLCVADLSGLHLVGPLAEQSLIGYNEGRSGDTNVFGEVTFSGSESDIQASAHRFRHDFTGDVGMAVTDGSETLLVWGNALDADGKYQEGDKTYSLVNDGEPLHEIPVPDANNFIYDGTAKTSVHEGIGYRILSGNVATNVGDYTAVVTTRAGFAWDDGTTGVTNRGWKIVNDDYVLKGVTFKDRTYVYDGTYKKLELTGTLPQGLSVRYENNIRWQPGTNEVKAVISGSIPNYKPDPFTTTLEAKLIIIDPAGRFHGEIEPPPPPTEVTNTPTPIAFRSITRVSDLEWALVVTSIVPKCEYRLIYTDDLTKGFTVTGNWERAADDADPTWETNVLFTTETRKPAYFWRAEGRQTVDRISNEE